MHCWLQIAVATGARRGELCALRWCDFDLDARTVRIERSVSATKKHGIFIKTTKTGRVRLVSITGQAVAEAYDFGGVGRVVDIAGGRGKMLASILKAHPQLRGTLFDLPRVVENALGLLVTEGVADRCEIVGGDMFTSVPPGGDLYLLAHVIHDWDDPRAIEVLRSCRHAMGPKAKLLIIDRAMPERVEASPLAQSNALADLTMMMFTGGGRERTANQFEALVSATGLRLERVIPMPILDSLIEATPL